MGGRVAIVAAVLLGFAGASVGAHARPSSRKSRKASCPKGLRSAKLVDLSRDHAFFGVGTSEGLNKGDEVRFVRRGQEVRRCTVDAAAAHQARCAVETVGSQDAACYVRAAAPQEAAQASQAIGPGRGRLNPPSIKKAQLALAKQGVPEVVDQSAGVTGPLSFRADAALSHSSFVRLGQGRPGTHRQTLSGSIRDIPLGFFDTRASVDFTVLTYAARPEEANYRTQANAMLFVHETSVARRSVDDGLVLAVGRIRPMHSPGVPFLDGAQVGFRFSDNLELGVLGGALPDLVRLEPSLDRWTAGAYGRWVVANSDLRWDGSARAGFVRGTASQGEVEASTRLGVSSWFAAALGARVRADRDGVGLSSLRGRVDLHPADAWTVGLDGRFRDAVDDPFAAGLPVVGASHGRATVRWQQLSWLSLGLVGAVGHLDADNLTLFVAGPEVVLPKLFGTLGGLSIGYQEAVGWLPGRNVWAQTGLHPLPELQLWLRATYREGHEAGGVLHEVGGFAQAGWQISRMIQVRGSLFSRVGFTGDAGSSAAANFVGRVALVAAL